LLREPAGNRGMSRAAAGDYFRAIFLMSPGVAL
jgi:hypothetical protein